MPSRDRLSSWTALLPESPTERSATRPFRKDPDAKVRGVVHPSEAAAAANARALERRLQQAGWLNATVTPTWEAGWRGAKLCLVARPGRRWSLGKVSFNSTGTGIPADVLLDLDGIRPGVALEMAGLRDAQDVVASRVQDLGMATFHSGMVSFELDTLSDARDAVAHLHVILQPWNPRTVAGAPSWMDTLASIPHPVVRIGRITWNGEPDAIGLPQLGGLRTELWRHSVSLRSGDVLRPQTRSLAYDRLGSLAAVDQVKLTQMMRWDARIEGGEGQPAVLVADVDYSVELKPDNDVSLELDMVRNNARYGPRLAATLVSRNRRQWGEQGTVQAAFGYVSVAPFSTFNSAALLNSGEWSLRWRASRAGMPPLRLDRFRPSAQPLTTWDAGWDREVWPEFTRSQWHASHEVSWVENPSRSSRITLQLLNANVVRLTQQDARFVEWLAFQDNPLVLARFNNHATLGSSASWESEWRMGAWRGSVVATGDWAGSVPQWVAESVFESASFDDVSGAWLVAPDVPLVQHRRGVVTLQGRRDLNRSWSYAWQAQCGLAASGKNTPSLPLEQSFFSGGANGTRGWTLRALGPGNFNAARHSGAIQGVGDMRLDFQQELRYQTRSAWQWAWFMDAGNVWLLEDGAPDVASFEGTKTSGLAWGAGTGLRYDLEFFILRLDAALRLHDPLQPDGARWLHQSQPRGAVHLGLGLPF